MPKDTCPYCKGPHTLSQCPRWKVRPVKPAAFLLRPPTWRNERETRIYEDTDRG